MGKKELHSGHRQRMMKRFLHSQGFYGYHPHEILEQFLFLCIPRANTNETAHRLINKFGSLEAVLRAPFDELAATEGVGPKSAQFILDYLPAIRHKIVKSYTLSEKLNIYEMTLLFDLVIHRQRDDRLGFVILDLQNRLIDFISLDDRITKSSIAISALINSYADVKTIIGVVKDKEKAESLKLDELRGILDEIGIRLSDVFYMTEWGFQSILYENHQIKIYKPNKPTKIVCNFRGGTRNLSSAEPREDAENESKPHGAGSLQKNSYILQNLALDKDTELALRLITDKDTLPSVVTATNLFSKRDFEE